MDAVVAQLAVVHEGNGSDLSRGQGCNADVQSEFSSGDEVMRHVADIFFPQESDGNGQHEITNDNQPINGGEVHAGLPPAKILCERRGFLGATSNL